MQAGRSVYRCRLMCAITGGFSALRVSSLGIVIGGIDQVSEFWRGASRGMRVAIAVVSACTRLWSARRHCDRPQMIAEEIAVTGQWGPFIEGSSRSVEAAAVHG